MKIKWLTGLSGATYSQFSYIAVDKIIIKCLINELKFNKGNIIIYNRYNNTLYSYVLCYY